MLTYCQSLVNGTPPAPYDQVLHLHVGLPKTGTSLLQLQFYPHHEQIAYLGKNAPGNGPLNKEVTRFIVETLRQRVFQCDVPTARRMFDRQIRPLMGNGKAVVLSMEDVSHGSARRRRAKLANLRAVCGDCRLLITLRNPLEFVNSMYLERLKRANCKPRKKFAKPWLPNLEQWLDDCWSRGEKADLSHLYYADFIADWENTFGADSVGVLLFEHLKQQPQAYFDRLASLLGIRSIETERLMRDPPVNPSWTPLQIDRLRQIMDSTYATLRFRLASRTRRCKVLGSLAGSVARLPLVPHWHARICETTQAGNRLLADHRQLPLAELGYPM